MSDSDSEGRAFESRRAHQETPVCQAALDGAGFFVKARNDMANKHNHVREESGMIRVANIKTYKLDAKVVVITEKPCP